MHKFTTFEIYEMKIDNGKSIHSSCFKENLRNNCRKIPTPLYPRYEYGKVR